MNGKAAMKSTFVSFDHIQGFNIDSPLFPWDRGATFGLRILASRWTMRKAVSTFPTSVLNQKLTFFRPECLFAWSDDSISQIISTFLFYLLPATLYFILAYTYYRQTTDPSHPANLCTHSVTRGSAIRMQAIPGDSNSTQYPYSPLYNNVSAPPSIHSPFALSPRHARRKSAYKAQVKDLALNLALDPALAASAPYSATVAPGPPSYSIGNSTYPFSIGDLSSGVEDDRFI